MNLQQILKKNPLFEGVQEVEIERALPCLGARKQLNVAGSYPVNVGDHIPEIGIVISGELVVIKEDLEGNKIITETLQVADMFGESFVCSSIVESPVAIYAQADTYILFLHLSRLLHSCGNACQHHGRIVNNLVRILANKSVTQERKIDVLSKRTTREKILAYLDTLYLEQRKNPVTLPISRGELAEFISADRSAMSREFSKLKSEGLIHVEKNQITLLKLQ